MQVKSSKLFTKKLCKGSKIKILKNEHKQFTKSKIKIEVNI